MANYLINLDYRVCPHDIKSGWSYIENYKIRTSGHALGRYLQECEKFPRVLNEYFLDALSKFFEIDNIEYKLTTDTHKIIFDTDILEWCFSPEWERLAQKKGEATLAERETGQRILWLLDYGLPDNWKSQMEGKEKPIYHGYTGLKGFKGKGIWVNKLVNTM